MTGAGITRIFPLENLSESLPGFGMNRSEAIYWGTSVDSSGTGADADPGTHFLLLDFILFRSGPLKQVVIRNLFFFVCSHTPAWERAGKRFYFAAFSKTVFIALSRAPLNSSTRFIIKKWSVSFRTTASNEDM